MVQKEYSAGAVKHSFWFLEFRKIIALLLDGTDMERIRQMSAGENIFSAPTAERAKQIFMTVSSRVRSLDERFYRVFAESDVATQKIIALISVMNTDALFFDFMYEVYREKLMLGSGAISDSDIRVFFKNKQVQSERAAGWQDCTLKRLGACCKTFLTEAGIASRGKAGVTIVKPVPDALLEQCLIDNGMEQFLHALTGVR